MSKDDSDEKSERVDEEEEDDKESDDLSSVAIGSGRPIGLFPILFGGDDGEWMKGLKQWLSVRETVWRIEMLRQIFRWSILKFNLSFTGFQMERSIYLT